MIEVLAGVLAGWLLSTASEELRAYRARQSAEAEAKADAREAALLIGEELLVSQKLLDDAVNGRGHEWDLSQQLPADVWNRRSPVLARSVDYTDTWSVASDAYAELDRINWKLRGFEDRGVKPSEWEEFQVRQAKALEKVQEAVSSLSQMSLVEARG